MDLGRPELSGTLLDHPRRSPMLRGLRRLVVHFGRRAFIEFTLSVHDIEVDCGVGQLSECSTDDLALIVAQRASVFGGA